MAQKYRIYINEKVILLTEKAPKGVEAYQQIDSETFDLKIIYTWILAHKSALFYVLCDDAKAYLKQVKKSTAVIKAAGGLVKNERGQLLFIYRNDKWDLPKGKIEKDETVKQAAVREVEEECSIVVDKLGEKICKTYHCYVSRGEVVLKKTWWYKMKCKGQNKLKPQKEEGITDVRWFNKDDVTEILNNTFPSITEVLETVKVIKGTQGLL